MHIVFSAGGFWSLGPHTGFHWASTSAPVGTKTSGILSNSFQLEHSEVKASTDDSLVLTGAGRDVGVVRVGRQLDLHLDTGMGSPGAGWWPSGLLTGGSSHWTVWCSS